MSRRDRTGGRNRTATAAEIDRRIRNAGDHIGGLIANEKTVAEAAERNEIDTELEAMRRFERDLQSFFGAARTARNYLIQKSHEFGCEAWLTARLAPELFEFHGAVADQDIHDHAVTVVKTYDVNWSGVVDVVRLVDGGNLQLIPRPTPPARLSGMRLTYIECDLEPTARRAHDAIKSGPCGQRGIIELAGDYIDGLRQIVRDADRDGLFAVSPFPSKPCDDRLR